MNITLHRHVTKETCHATFLIDGLCFLPWRRNTSRDAKRSLHPLCSLPLSTPLIDATGGVRGTLGASEIIEALSDPEKAKNFATRIRDLFRDGDINDWVGTG